MSEIIQLGDISITVTRKTIKHVHLSVHPPEGRVTLSTPMQTRLDLARAFAVTKLGWIRAQQAKLRAQARESPRDYVERESHYLWGCRYLLSVVERKGRPDVTLDHKQITLYVRPDSDRAARAAVMQAWHRQLLHEAIPPLIAKWEPKLGVKVKAYFLQRMKTRWGSCNYRAGHIRLNTELVKKPRHLLEYVVVHEMTHFLEPSHDARFVALMDKHFPFWRAARAELNALPLAAEEWAV